MATELEVSDKLRELGITNPARLQPAHVKTVLDAYLNKHTLNADAFKAALCRVDPATSVIFEGLKAFAVAQGKVSADTMNLMEQGIGVLKAELSREGLSGEERSRLHRQVIELIAEARKESQESRDWFLKLTVIGGGVVVCGLGVAVLAISGGRSKELLVAGGKMVAKSLEKPLA
jgi:hypothetical protein